MLIFRCRISSISRVVPTTVTSRLRSPARTAAVPATSGATRRTEATRCASASASC